MRAAGALRGRQGAVLSAQAFAIYHAIALLGRRQGACAPWNPKMMHTHWERSGAHGSRQIRAAEDDLDLGTTEP